MFNCHSEKMYHIWLALDLSGISLALCGCYIPSVYYAFYCQPVCKSVNNISLFPIFNAGQSTLSNAGFHLLLDHRNAHTLEELN
jgi:hypothetical protein